MKNISHLFKSSILPRLENRIQEKTTEVEGLVLDNLTRRPLGGARIAIHLVHDDLGRVQVFETFTDNNGYFSGAFRAEEDVFTITPYLDAFNYHGSLTFSQAGDGAVECEEVRYGKKQFFTFGLENGVRKSRPVVQSASQTLKSLFYFQFQRVTAWLGLRSLFLV